MKPDLAAINNVGQITSQVLAIKFQDTTQIGAKLT